MAAKNGKRVGVWIILGLLFVGLVGFGGAGLTGSVRSIGTVDGTEVPIVAYQNSINSYARSLSAQSGVPVSFATLQQIGADREILNALINRYAIDAEVARMGISVGDERVRETVVSNPSFAGINGEFDRLAYRDLLDRNGLTEEAFEAQVRAEAARSLLETGVASAVTMPDSFLDVIVGYQAERRDVTWASVGAEFLAADLPEPTGEELRAFHAENPDLFTAPETRDITYAWLTPDMLRDGVEVDEAALRELYQDRIRDYVVPETRLVERMPFADEEAAIDAMNRIAAGEIDFDALAEERGVDLSLLDMGDVTEAQLGEAGADVFSSATGEVVGPLPSPLGSALYRTNAIFDARETTFEEAMPDLRDELATARARRMIDESREAITDLLAGGAQLEDLAERTDLELGSLRYFDGVEDGIAAYDGFRAAAVAAEPGAYPELQDLEDGGVFVLRVDAITEPAVQPIEDVAEELRTAWEDRARAAAVLARAEELATQVGAGSDLTLLGLAPVTEADMTRRIFVPGTPPGFGPKVFELAEGETAVVAAGPDAIILRVDAIRAPDMDSEDVQALRGALAAQMNQDLSDAVYQVFEQTIRTNADLDIDQNVINQVNAQLQ